MQPCHSLLCSHLPASSLCPEPDESSQHLSLQKINRTHLKFLSGARSVEYTHVRKGVGKSCVVRRRQLWKFEYHAQYMDELTSARVSMSLTFCFPVLFKINDLIASNGKHIVSVNEFIMGWTPDVGLLPLNFRSCSVSTHYFFKFRNSTVNLTHTIKAFLVENIKPAFALQWPYSCKYNGINIIFK